MKKGLCSTVTFPRLPDYRRWLKLSPIKERSRLHSARRQTSHRLPTPCRGRAYYGTSVATQVSANRTWPGTATRRLCGHYTGAGLPRPLIHLTFTEYLGKDLILRWLEKKIIEALKHHTE